jgi:hypothetical protein
MRRNEFIVMVKQYSDLAQFNVVLLRYVKPLYIGLNVVTYFKNKFNLR